MIAAAKAKPDGISFGSVGTGSLGHLTMTLLGKRAGVRLTHVPYRGGGPAMNDARCRPCRYAHRQRGIGDDPDQSRMR